MITGTVRLYFNKKGELPWRVDTGPGTHEFQVREVVIAGAVCGRTAEAQAVTDPEHMPISWVEFTDAMVRFSADDACATIVSMS